MHSKFLAQYYERVEFGIPYYIAKGSEKIYEGPLKIIALPSDRSIPQSESMFNKSLNNADKRRRSQVVEKRIFELASSR